MNHTPLTEASIDQMVRAFYAKVRQDELLSPIFLAAIGNDAANWEIHLNKMVTFWSSVMLASGKYHGNPLQKHKNLPPFDQSLFDRWLKLFAETAHELHNDQTAFHYIEKATRIAESLKIGLYYIPAQNTDETTT